MTAASPAAVSSPAASRAAAQPDRPHQLAALERPLAVDAVRAPVAGPVVDRAQEERRVGVGDVGEVGGS